MQLGQYGVADFYLDNRGVVERDGSVATDTTFTILGVAITATSLDRAAHTLEGWAGDKLGRFVCIRDTPSLVHAQDDAGFKALHSEAAMVTPDGAPLALIGWLRGHDVRRTCGPDLFDLMMSRSAQNGLKHYFYGGKDGVAETLRRRMEAKYPGVRIVGTECPPFRQPTQEEERETIDRIVASGADIVWVGMSSPKQEFWMARNRDKLPATLIGVGAAFDFHSGEVERAPRWMQESMLEWLHRLCTEPRRLWRRYLILAPRFVILAGLETLLAARLWRRRRTTAS